GGSRRCPGPGRPGTAVRSWWVLPVGRRPGVGRRQGGSGAGVDLAGDSEGLPGFGRVLRLSRCCTAAGAPQLVEERSEGGVLAQQVGDGFPGAEERGYGGRRGQDRKSTRLNSSHVKISYA